MGSEGAGGSVTIRLGFFSRHPQRDGLHFVQSSGSMLTCIPIAVIPPSTIAPALSCSNVHHLTSQWS